MKSSKTCCFLFFIVVSAFTSNTVFCQSPAQAGWWSDAVNSVRDEVKNCFRGGCDPTKTSPREAGETAIGYRAFGAATDRWLGRQVRIRDAQANELKQKLKQYVNDNYQCMELPETAGVCSELNSFYGLNMRVVSYSWNELAKQYNSKNIDYLQRCINQKGLTLDGPRDFQCFRVSNYTE